MKKSAVMTLANALHYKKHIDRPTALRRAWRMIKQAVFNAKAVGVSFGLRQVALQHLKAYSPARISVTLKAEPNNKHDKHAIAVLVSVDNGKAYKIGYLPSSSIWTGLVNRKQVRAAIDIITGGNGKMLGFNFKLSIV